jgi:hypothetical protein
MKKGIFIALAIGLFSFSFVSAFDLGDNLEKGSEQIVDAVEGLVGPFASVFLGGGGDLLFERILFFAIVFSIVYVILSTRIPLFQGQPAIVWIVTIAVSLLSTRFLTDTQIIMTIILPHSVLGITLSAIIPLIIFFFFVESFSQSAILRKTLWIFFLIVFVGLWASRYDELGDFSWIYMMTGIAAFLLFLFDGTIRRAIIRQQMKEVDVNNREEFLAKLRKNLDELKTNEKYYRPATFKRLEKKLMRQIKNATKI